MERTVGRTGGSVQGWGRPKNKQKEQGRRNFAPPGSDKYRDPRWKDSWNTLSVVNRYHTLPNYVKMLCEDFLKACHVGVCELAEHDEFGWPSFF